MSSATGWGEFMNLQNLVYIRGCNIHVNDTESFLSRGPNGCEYCVRLEVLRLIPWGPNNRQIADVPVSWATWEAPKPLLGPQCCRDQKRGAYMQCFVALLGPTPDCARWYVCNSWAYSGGRSLPSESNRHYMLCNNYQSRLCGSTRYKPLFKITLSLPTNPTKTPTNPKTHSTCEEHAGVFWLICGVHSIKSGSLSCFRFRRGMAIYDDGCNILIGNHVQILRVEDNIRIEGVVCLEPE